MEFTGGLIKDVALLEMPDNSWRNARNIVQNIDNTISNEYGFLLRKVLDEDFQIIGSITTTSCIIIFSVNGYVGEIGKIQNNTYSRIIRDKGYIFSDRIFDSFKFSINHPIEGTFYYNYKGELIIVWTDNYNSPKLLNVDTLNGIPVTASKIYNPSFPYVIPPGAQGSYRIEEITELNLFHTFEHRGYISNPEGAVPNPIVTNVANNVDNFNIIKDNKKVLTVIPFLRKLDNTDTYTQWYGGISVTTIDTTKQQLKITNLSNVLLGYGYKSYQIGLLYVKEGITSFDIIYDGSGTTDIIYDFENVIQRDIPISDVLIPKSKFDKCATLTQVDDRLICGNIKQVDIGYQKYANNIVTNWKIDHAVVNGNIPKLVNPDTVGHYVLCPDEVYAFYIHFVLKDGRETQGYHIPGRVADVGETTVVDTIRGISAKRFHVEDTASIVSGSIAGYDAIGKFGYWENENEVYPTTGEDIKIYNNTGQIGTLSGKVRHHKTPTLYRTLGHNIKPYFTNIYIPENLLDSISGAYISFASRDGNKTLLDFSLVTNNTFFNNTDVLYDDEDLINYAELFCHPFDLLSEQAEVAIDYIKYAYRYSNVAYVNTSPRVYLPSVVPDYIVSSAIKVDKHAYIPRDSNIFNNEKSDAKLVLKGVTNIAGTIPNFNGSGANTTYHICSIHSFKRDVYYGFNNQQLIPLTNIRHIGRTNNNISAVDKGLTTSIETYGGDIITVGINMPDIYYINYGATIPNVANVTYHKLKYATVSKFDNVRYFNDSYALEVTMQGLGYSEDGKTYAKKWLDEVLYYTNYPANNSYKNPIPYTFNSNFISQFDNRIVRSIVVSKESKDIAWRTFLANEYYELERQKKQITALQGFLGNLIIHTPYSTFIAKNKDVLLTNNVEAYLGKADILESKPEQFIDLIEGYAGCIHKFGRLVTKYGYIYVDGINGKIFLIKDAITEISNTGISNLLKARIKFVGDNPFAYDGITLGYDVVFERLLVSITADSGQATITLSYSLTNNYWIALHDYTTNYYANDNTNLYGIVNIDSRGGIYVLNSTIGGKCIYYHTDLETLPTRTIQQSYIEPVFVYDKTISKLLHSINWQSSIFSSTNELLEFKTITAIAIYSQSHYTGIIVLEDTSVPSSELTTDRHLGIMYNTKRDGLYRNVEGQWNFNEIRDALIHNITVNKVLQPETRFIDEYGILNTTQINVLGNFVKEYFNKHLFIDRVFAVRMIYDNKEQNTLILHNVDINIGQSYR